MAATAPRRPPAWVPASQRPLGPNRASSGREFQCWWQEVGSGPRPDHASRRLEDWPLIKMGADRHQSALVPLLDGSMVGRFVGQPSSRKVRVVHAQQRRPMTGLLVNLLHELQVRAWPKSANWPGNIRWSMRPWSDWMYLITALALGWALGLAGSGGVAASAAETRPRRSRQERIAFRLRKSDRAAVRDVQWPDRPAQGRGKFTAGNYAGTAYSRPVVPCARLPETNHRAGCLFAVTRSRSATISCLAWAGASPLPNARRR